VTDTFLTQELVDDSFGCEEVVAKKTNTHMTAASLDELVGSLMIAKGFLHQTIQKRN